MPIEDSVGLRFAESSTTDGRSATNHGSTSILNCSSMARRDFEVRSIETDDPKYMTI